jgi:flavin-dependent thymidylate synthase
MSGSDIVRYGDAAMYESVPIRREEGTTVVPSVTLLSATPDPLGSLAAGFRMYRGDPVYDLQDITDEQRLWAWDESIKTHLKAPWEFIDLMFMIEGVTRSFTHQLVRQRTAVYAQESLRFAVKRGFAHEAALPPHIVPGPAGDEPAFKIWCDIMQDVEDAYEKLIALGIPAEDARSILPHCVTTRVIYKTNLRGLLEHAGNRLCTQAQFEWRSVFLGIIKSIRNKKGYMYKKPSMINDGVYAAAKSDWQFEKLASPIPATFAPVCYKAGHCVFMGTIDRGCTIRDRVQAFSEAGIGADRWAEGTAVIPPIEVEEWMANANAGITWSDEDRPK